MVEAGPHTCWSLRHIADVQMVGLCRFLRQTAGIVPTFSAPPAGASGPIEARVAAQIGQCNSTCCLTNLAVLQLGSATCTCSANTLGTAASDHQHIG